MVTNSDICELMARLAATSEGFRQRAYRKASRAAMLWPVEASDVVEAGHSLEELHGIGPGLSRRIQEWLDEPPEIDEPPESRRGFLTLTEARRALDEHPEWRAEIKGDLQMHTTASDGQSSIRVMAEAAAALGHEYIAITDHTKGLKIAGGIDEEELAVQGQEIDQVNTALEASGPAIRVLKGTEMNLRIDGSGDVEPSALKRLDIVVGSFHSQLRTTDDQTERYLSAVDNPDVHVIGHPRGRKFDQRAGLHADWPRVFAAATEQNKAFEIDAFPDRQDLQVDLLREAGAAGTLITISTDAHATWELDHFEFGLALAAIAGVPREKVLNLKPVEELLEWTAELRSRV